MSFSTHQIDELRRSQAELARKHADLEKRLLVHNFRTDAGREHAHHGLARRLGLLARCVERVFALLPPNRRAIPKQASIVDATVNIQAFVMNAFGFRDNVAWVWVHECGIRRTDGRPLTASEVGLGPKCERVRQAMTPDFRDYLSQLELWFANLKNFRDALAHRIPLYIPPYTVRSKDVSRFRALDIGASDALLAHDFEGYERLRREQTALKLYQPIMTHSLTSDAAHVVFHPQLLADFNTLERISGCPA